MNRDGTEKEFSHGDWSFHQNSKEDVQKVILCFGGKGGESLIRSPAFFGVPCQYKQHITKKHFRQWRINLSTHGVDVM